MAESVSANISLQLTATETLDATLNPAASVPNVVHKGFNVSKTLNGTSTPTVTKVVAAKIALVAGAKTVDLTSLTGTNGATKDFSTLKVRSVLIVNPDGNSGDMVFTFGASNGYLLMGTGWKITLKPGDAFENYLTGAPTVDATHKNIDVTGTGTEQFEIEMVAG